MWDQKIQFLKKNVWISQPTLDVVSSIGVDVAHNSTAQSAMALYLVRDARISVATMQAAANTLLRAFATTASLLHTQTSFGFTLPSTELG